jgi:hypothetical protein
MTSTELDELIFSIARPYWQKVAMIIGNAARHEKFSLITRMKNLTSLRIELRILSQMVGLSLRAIFLNGASVKFVSMNEIVYGFAV